MKKVLKSKKGFTLMEMLIVVAIIVILVAISVPTFNNSLNGAKQQTDAANMRAAKVVANSQMMLAQTGDETAPTANMEYNADTSKFVADGTVKTGYGQAGDNKGKIISIKAINDDGTVELEWTEVNE